MEQTVHVGHDGGMVTEVSEAAARLRMLQELLEGRDHGAGSRMARRLRVSAQHWHNAKQARWPSLNIQHALVRHIPGMSADWIQYGREEGLSYQLAEAIRRFNNRQNHRL